MPGIVAQAEEARRTMPERVKISTDQLDAWLYRPLEHHATTSPLPRFERLSDSGLRTADADVLLHEGVATSNILELPSCRAYTERFYVPFTYEVDGESEPGLLLACRQPNTFLMFYGPARPDGSEVHALMVSHQRIMRVLDMMGYDRMTLGKRDMLIRESGKPGMFRSVNPDVVFYYNMVRKTKPISIGINISRLAKMATAEFVASESELVGHWVHKQLTVRGGN